MSLFCYDSREAYNGCLTLYSVQERTQRGDYKLSLSSGEFAKHKSKTSVGCRTRQHKLQKSNLPNVRVEKVNDLACNFDGSFVGYVSRSGKVVISEEKRNINDIFHLLKSANSNIVKKIWSRDVTWTACYDILSSLYSLNLNYTNVNDFSLSEHDWPLLQSKDSGEFKTSSFSIISAPENDAWTLIEEEDVSSEDWELISSIIVEDSKSNSAMIDGYNTSLLTEENLSKYREEITQESVSAKCSMKRSYRDALITTDSETQITNNTSRPIKHTTSSRWSPQYNIISISSNRVDRIYSKRNPTVDNGM